METQMMWSVLCSTHRIHAKLNALLMFLVFQGGELARQSALQDGDYSKFYFDDARTMYESFLRGLRVSSTYVPSVCWCSRWLHDVFKLALLLRRISAVACCKSWCLFDDRSVFLSPPDDGPCLGSRKPKQPYKWLSYSEVIAAIIINNK